MPCFFLLVLSILMFVEIQISTTMETSLHEHFKKLPDTRIHRNKKHLLIDIVIMTITSVICGADSWNSIELFGKAKKDFLSKFLTLPNGIPSHDTINRVISSINQDKFEGLFTQWVNSIKDQSISSEVIAIDGKTVRRSKDTYHNKKPIHLVSAWANSNKLVLGQKKVEDKSNEITAIPELLKILDIEDSIITIDAMGTQRKIAEEIITQKANYILALKGNNSYLEEDVKNIFNFQKPGSTNQTVEKGHGRIETRKCEVITDLTFLEDKEKWSKLKAIVRITSKREINEKVSTENRFYISSLDSQAKDFNTFIREHWGVENSLHWTLDMTFREDQQRKRINNAAQNFALIQKIALNLLKSEDSKNISIKSKRLKAAWDEKFLLKILKI